MSLRPGIGVGCDVSHAGLSYAGVLHPAWLHPAWLCYQQNWMFVVYIWIFRSFPNSSVLYVICYSDISSKRTKRLQEYSHLRKFTTSPACIGLSTVFSASSRNWIHCLEEESRYFWVIQYVSRKKVRKVPTPMHKKMLLSRYFIIQSWQP